MSPQDPLKLLSRRFEDVERTWVKEEPQGSPVRQFAWGTATVSVLCGAIDLHLPLQNGFAHNDYIQCGRPNSVH